MLRLFFEKRGEDTPLQPGIRLRQIWHHAETHRYQKKPALWLNSKLLTEAVGNITKKCWRMPWGRFRIGNTPQNSQPQASQKFWKLQWHSGERNYGWSTGNSLRTREGKYASCSMICGKTFFQKTWFFLNAKFCKERLCSSRIPAEHLKMQRA